MVIKLLFDREWGLCALCTGLSPAAEIAILAAKVSQSLKLDLELYPCHPPRDCYDVSHPWAPCKEL